MPVPKAFEMASLPAKRAARNGPGAVCDRQYANSDGRSIRSTKSVAKPLVGRFDALHFDNVDAGAKDHRDAGLASSMSSAARAHQQQHLPHGGGQARPRAPRLMMLWPMFNSTRWGTCRSTARFW